jgi:hypothetical protein
MRPLTVGELLDAAVTLLRTRWLLLVGLGAAAAAVEQAVLFPLRRLADVNLYYFPPEDRWPAWTLLVAVGFATEAAVIAALGGPASAAAPGALLGDAAPRPERPGRPAAATAVVAVLVAFLCGLVMLTMFTWPISFFLLSLVTIPLWLCTYGSLGLAVPAVVIERRGPFGAVGRSVTLSARGFLRTIRVRVLAYLGWWVIRVGWGLGVLSVIGLVYTPPNETVDNVLMAVIYLVVNALAYPALACLDAVLLLEARMRTEGLDIALRQALRLRVDPTPVLVGRA